MIRVLVWNEYYHEKTEERIAKVYPKGIHGAIADFLGKEEDIVVKTATLDDENCGRFVSEGYVCMDSDHTLEEILDTDRGMKMGGM